MKTVVLDGYCANPGDLGWDWLGRFGSGTVYDRTPAAETAGRIGDAEAVLTNKTVIDRAVMASCPGLRYIGVMATGYNVIDLEAARERGIVVTNVPGYSTDSVAQLTFAMMLYFANRVDCFNDWVKQGGWQACPDFSRLVTPIFELAGKTVGIIGFGAIGRRVAEMALAFGMRVLAFSRHLRQADCPEGVEAASVDAILRRSDFVTLHCPLTEETAGIIGREALHTMKKTAYLINTARGPLIDEAALREALRDGVIAGAAVDVASREPIAADSPLLGAPNLLITPHIAWATAEARARLMQTLQENLAAFAAGQPINRVGL